MAKYQAKPVVIEALLWSGDNFYEMGQFIACSHGFPTVGVLRLKTLEGWTTVFSGEYIIKGTQGEFYPCKPDIFKEKYEIVK